MANERRRNNLDVQMRERFQECAWPGSAAKSESLILGAIDTMLASDDPRSPQSELEVRATVDRPTLPRMDTQWLVAIEFGEARRSCNQMAFFGAHRLRAIDQTTRPNARATGRVIIEQTKPLGAAITPRADEQRPDRAAGKRLRSYADLVLDPDATETNERRVRFRPNVAMRPQCRSLDHRQIVDRALHGGRQYRY